MAKKFGTYGKNVIKSLGKAGLSATKDLMPNLSNSIKENKDFIADKYREVKDRPRNSDIQSTFLYRTTKSLVQNALEDLKTGNLNNTDREKKAETDAFAEMFNIDMSAFELDELDLESGSSESFSMGDSSATAGDINTESFNITADFSEETKYDIKTIAKMGGANLRVLNMGMTNLSAQLTTLTQFHNENTTRFYQTVETKLNEISSNLDIVSSYYKDMFENSKRDHGPKDSLMADFFGKSGLNLKEWLDISKETTDSSAYMDLFKMGLDIAKTQASTIAANPLGFLLKSGVKTIIPKRIKNTMGRFDEMFGMLPLLVQGFENSDNFLFKSIGKMFNLNKFKIKNNKYKYEKGAISFDGETKRAITQVIPGYLSRILTAVSSNNQDKNLHYDYDMGKFVTDADVKRKIRQEIDDSLNYAMSKDSIKRITRNAVEEAKSKGIVESDDEVQEYIDKIGRSIKNMTKKGKSFHSIKDLSEISNDKDLAQILMNAYTKQSVEEKRSTVADMGRGFIDYQTYLKNNSHNDLYQQAFSNGKYKIDTKYAKQRMKIRDIGKTIRAKKDDILGKAKDKADGKVKNTKFKKFINFFTSEEETKLDKKLNDVYETLLNPLNRKKEQSDFMKNAESKIGEVKAAVNKIDINDIKETLKQTKAKVNNEKSIFTTKPDIKTTNGKSSPVVKVHVVGGTLTNVNKVNEVVNVDDVDENDSPHRGSASEQRKRMKKDDKNNTSSSIIKDVDKDPTTGLPLTEEQQNGEDLLDKASDALDIVDNLRNSGLMDKFSNSKLGKKVGGWLGKSKLGSKLKNGALELATNPNGAKGGIKTLLGKGVGKLGGLFKFGKGAKVAGATGKLAGGVSKLGGLAKTAGAIGKTGKIAGIAAKAGGLLSGVGSALGGVGSAVAGAATAAAPFLLPALAAGGLIVGATKLFKKNKVKTDENGNVVYDENGNPVMTSTMGKIGSGIARFGKKLVSPITGLFKKNKVKKDENGNVVYDEDGNPVMTNTFGKIGNNIKNNIKNSFKNSIAGKLFNKKKKKDDEEEISEKDQKSSKFKEMMKNSPFNNIHEFLNKEKKEKNEEIKEEDKVAKTERKEKLKGKIKGIFESSPLGMLYKFMKKDKDDKEKKDKKDKNKPETKMANFLEPVNKYFKSGNFSNVFGSNGLFVGMRDGMLGKEGNPISNAFKKLFGALFDSASKDVYDAAAATGQSVVMGSGGLVSSNASTGASTGSGSTSNGTGTGTATPTSGSGSISTVADLINRSLKINSGVSAEDIDNMIAEVKGTDNYMYGTGKDFIDAGKASGLDPLYLAAHAILETGWGTSSILKDKHNWYGIGAFDSSAYESAYNYDSKRAGIIEGAKWIANNYTNNAEKQDTLYKMINSTNNHNYATDKEWANKIATIMLQLSGGTVNGGTGTSTNSNGSGKVNNGTIQKAMDAAASVLHYPYVWGGESVAEGGFDCSGLCQYAYKQAGINIPRTTGDLINFGTAVPLAGPYGNDNAQPGDLLFPNTGHVYMYAGNGKAYEAMDESLGIGLTDAPMRNKSIAIRRIVNQGTVTANGLNRTINSQAINNDLSKTNNVHMVSVNQYTNMRNTDKNNVMLQVKNVMDEINESGETTNELLNEMLSLVTKMKNIKENENVTIDNPFNMTTELNALFAGY